MLSQCRAAFSATVIIIIIHKYVLCKVHKVNINTESEAPAVARWAALVGYAKR